MVTKSLYSISWADIFSLIASSIESVIACLATVAVIDCIMGRNLKLKKQHSAMNRMKIKIHFFLIPLLRRRLRRRYLRTATPSFKICAIRTTSIILTKR